MNASDITALKRNQTLYQAYVVPAITGSTIYSTLNTVSSIGGGSTHTTSTLSMVFKTGCSLFETYEDQREANAGRSLYSQCSPQTLQWKATQPTTLRAYQEVYSTLSQPSTVGITSTIIQTAPSPMIC